VRTAAAVLGGVVVGLIVAIGLVVTLGRNDSSRRESAATSGASAVSTSSSAPSIDRDGHVLVFLERDITEAERQTIEAALDSHPQVAGHEFWD
jgi:hypothetical protein